MAIAENEGLRTGVVMSLVLHAGVALVVTLGLPSLWSKPQPIYGVVSVDLVMESADSLAVYEPQELTTSEPEVAQTETFEQEETLADQASEPVELEETAAVEVDKATPQEQLEESQPEQVISAEDISPAKPDPALENAVTLAQTIPPEKLESREVQPVEPVTTEAEPLTADTLSVEAKTAPSIAALVASEVLPDAEISTAVAAPVQIDEIKSEDVVVATAEIAPEAPTKPVLAKEAEVDLPIPAIPLPVPPLPRKKPQRIAALAPTVETEPKKKKAKDRPKKKKARSFADKIASSLSSKPRKRARSGNAARLSNSEWDPLRAAIKECWRLDRGAKEQVTVSVQVQLTKGGRLKGAPKWLDPSGSNSARVAYQRAVQALQNCQPFFGLPLNKYAGWREVELVFKPDGVGFQ